MTGGPEPGYRPALTGLTGRGIAKATAAMDGSGSVWLVNITFTPAGAQKFARLTRDNIAACAGDPTISASANCAQRHIAIWLSLTQSDIDSWDDPQITGKVSQAFDWSCLTRAPSSAVCAKFVSDPITIQEITGGRAQIVGAFTEQTAKQLAAANSYGSHAA